MKPLLVQFAERTWTLEALHLACAMARDEGTFVVLLRLIEIERIAWLGTTLGNLPPTEREFELLKECQLIADLYEVPLSIQSMQYHSLLEALAQAADMTDAQAVLAQLPQSKLTFINKLRHWNLKRQLAAKNRQWLTLEQSSEVEEWLPSVLVSEAK